MTRKRLHKLLMSVDFDRNMANDIISVYHDTGFTNDEILEHLINGAVSIDTIIQVIKTTIR